MDIFCLLYYVLFTLLRVVYFSYINGHPVGFLRIDGHPRPKFEVAWSFSSFSDNYGWGHL